MKPTYEELEARLRELQQEAVQRRRTQEALRESEERLRTILDTIQAGVLVIDPASRCVVGVNTAAANMIGASLHQVLRSECQGRICPAQRGQCPVLDLGQTFSNTEHTLITAAGNRMPILKTVVSVFLAGREHLLESFVDVTERKEAERILQRTNEELKGFINFISHDLKNPITAIRGFCALISRKYDQAIGEKGLEYLRHIEDSARRMEALVSDLLSLSRLGRMPCQYRLVQSRELVQRVAEGLSHVLERTAARFTVAPDLPPVWCDPERIYQVFDNLIANALKFTSDGKRPEIKVGYEKEGDFHKFHVSDNGIGIDTQYHHAIFQMFKRLGQKRDERGTGLGLAIVERIVKDHGGQVWVESQKGRGATFYFTVPDTAAPTSDDLQQRSPSACGNRLSGGRG